MKEVSYKTIWKHRGKRPAPWFRHKARVIWPLKWLKKEVSGQVSWNGGAIAYFCHDDRELGGSQGLLGHEYKNAYGIDSLLIMGLKPWRNSEQSGLVKTK